MEIKIRVEFYSLNLRHIFCCLFLHTLPSYIGNIQIDLDKVLFGFNYEICNQDLEFITSFAKDYGVTTSKEFYSG